MRCSNCGKTIDSTDPFCGYCGAPVVPAKRFVSTPVLLLIGLVLLAVLVAGVSAMVFVLRSAAPTPTIVAYASQTPAPTAIPTRPTPVSTATAVPSPTPKPTEAAPTASPVPATPIVIIVTATWTPSSTPLPTATPTPTPTPWFGFVSLRWEPSQPHWGDDVVFYAKFNNTLAEPRYLSWLVEICRADCPNWRVLMFQTKRKEDTVPPGGVSEVVSNPPWPLRGPGGTQTFPVRFAHVQPDDTRIGETIFYITISPR